MNAIVPQAGFGLPSTRFASLPAENDLAAGISGGYGHIGYKGKVWSTRYKGDEVPLMREDGDGPRGSVELVILKASQAISKVWYEKGFEDGTKAPPDCFSANGVTPDPSSTKKQCNVCALCPKNAFGSATKQDGTPGKGKACSDSKRLAVVPLFDLQNEMLGGPMLLRVPAASLNDVATYGVGVQKLGFPYYGVGTRIAFDSKVAHPQFVLSPIRALTDAEADVVLELRKDPRVDRILAESEYAPAPAEDAKPAMAFEQPAATPAQPVAQTQPEAQPEPVIKPSPRRAAKPAPVAAAEPVVNAGGGFGGPAPETAAVAQPVAQPVQTAAAPVAQAETAATGTDFDAQLDAELEALMGSPAA
jgi:pyruvate/2-oxoglutarate dehydrogenase complex dihydrolipoamide acyltransferase (E2) component